MPYSITNDSNDNVYVNIVIDHNDSNGNEASPAEYRVTKTLNIIDDPSKYYGSIIRFDIPLNTVPIWICDIIPPPTTIPVNPNLTPYKIGVKFLDGTGTYQYFTTNLIFEPEDLFDPVPIQNVPGKQIITPYYWCYSYQTMLNMINNGLNTVFTAFQTAFPLAPQFAVPFNTSSSYPFFEEIKGTQNLFEIIFNRTLINSQPTFSGPGNEARIYCNQELLNFIDGFPLKYNGNNRPNGDDYEIDLSSARNFDAYNSPTPLLPTDPLFTFFSFGQEYSTITLWNAVRKIVITTSSIPIVSEYTPQQGNDVGLSSSLPIFSDFIPIFENAGETRTLVVYNPQSQYRLVDLSSTSPLQTIDVKIYWQDKHGNLYPLLISVEQQASIKIGFFKKSLYNLGLNLLKK